MLEAVLPNPAWASFTTVTGAVLLSIGIVLRVIALGVIPGNRKPTSGMAWLLVILASPGLGLLVFSFFGTVRLGRRRHERQQRANAAIRTAAEQIPGAVLDAATPRYVHSVVDLNQRLGSLPALGGTQVEIIQDYHGSLKAMTEAVAGARSYVLAEFYITAWDDTTDALFQELAAAAERGVKVRMLFDHLGSRRVPGYRDLRKRLARTRIEAYPMLPINLLRRRFRRPDLRNHRKLLVVDGQFGFTGSQNLTEPGYNQPANHRIGREWVDLMVRLRGPVVATLSAVFAADWYTETAERIQFDLDVTAPEVTDTGAVGGLITQLVPSGPGFSAENNLRMFTTLIYSATRRISLTSPYFVPDESLLYAVTTAAQRGVDVELFVSEVSDQFMVGHAQASYYRALLEAGVTIHLYRAPFILHSKHFTIDDDVAVVGSSNMDMRSFTLNYEISLMMLGPEIVARMREVEDSYRAVSRPLSLEEWSRRSPGLKYVDNVMRLTAALQ
jgi:cardiolipin synthase